MTKRIQTTLRSATIGRIIAIKDNSLSLPVGNVAFAALAGV